MSQFSSYAFAFQMMAEQKVKCGNYFRIFHPSVTCKDKYKTHYVCQKISLVFHLFNLIPYIIDLRAVYCVCYHVGLVSYSVLHYLFWFEDSHSLGM